MDQQTRIKRPSRRFSKRLAIPIVSLLGIILIVAATNDEKARPAKQPPGSNTHTSHARKPMFTARRPLSTLANSTKETPLTNATSDQPPKQYWPDDIFDLATRRRGAVLLHVVGVVYMFVALAIVCDEYFVPSLDVIASKLNLSNDVAGATFMAAGGSTPELFTSFFGVFVAKTNVGFGTIVGSAVFNVLFVIGMCAVVSRKVLRLSWWPLFRDCSFYSVALIVLLLVYLDAKIAWFEALSLFVLYLVYVGFMKFNRRLETWAKEKLTPDRVRPIEKKNKKPTEETSSRPCTPYGVGFTRQGAVHLLLSAMHHRDTATDSRTTSKRSVRDEKPRNQVVPRVGIELAPPPPSAGASNPRTSFVSEQLDVEFTPSSSEPSSSRHSVIKNESEVSYANSAFETTKPSLGNHSNDDDDDDDELEHSTVPHVRVDCANGTEKKKKKKESAWTDSTNDDNEEEEKDGNDDEPLTIKWPSSCRKRFTYILLIPIVYLLYFSLPDVRDESKRKWYPWSFAGSMLWIGIYSYFMVWWANQIGDTIGISPEVMGLTFLAAGTSIPDLITSVIVARQGSGDMAVSSSIGSNMFDVTVGLPLPWFFAALIRGNPVVVTSNGLFCSVALLFGMLIVLVATIVACKWKMNRSLGVVMFLFYVLFLTISILLETKTIGKCFL